MQTVSQQTALQKRIAATREADRAKLVQLCNVAAGELGWKKNDLWDVIKLEHGGHSSLKEMTVEELEKILAFAKTKGFKVRHKTAKGKTSRPLSQEGQAKKLRALWLDMFSLGLVREADESALCSWATNSRSANVTTDLSIMAVEDLTANIERLKQWRSREIMKGQMFCPACGKAFKPSPKQAALLGRLACDAHDPAAVYEWRKPKAST